MEVPFHPAIVHIPLAITIVLPVLIIIFALMIRSNKMSPQSWLVIVGLQLLVVITGYVSLETGETEEERVEKVVAREFIHEHEEAAEVFVGSAVITLVLSIAAFFIRKEIGFPLKLGIATLTVLSAYLAYRAGSMGGELVYKHGAGSAYMTEDAQHGILPTPGMNTSESHSEVNESLKQDDNDYGNADEASDISDDDLKQED